MTDALFVAFDALLDRLLLVIAFALVICALLLASCTTAQVATVQGYQDQIVSACNLALPLAAVPMIGTYITAGCATEQAIAKLALDPSSLAWVNGLIVKAKAVKPA